MARVALLARASVAWFVAALGADLPQAALPASAASATALASEQLCAGARGDIALEALVLSSTRNPRALLRHADPDRERFCGLLRDAAARGTARLPTCRVLGFTGWRACAAGEGSSTPRCALLGGDLALDELLLQAFQREENGLQSGILEHIESELKRLRHGGGDAACADEPLVPPVPAAAPEKCSAPIRGPDDPRKVHFDPDHDDSGCFVTKQTDNNCYDYANDIASNSFAQPGRGSGVCPPSARPCVNNTCEEVRRAAVSDGLKWVGTDLPTELPETGHYVSLHIWPNTNFHWLRMDADMYFSHKPGGSPVRNVDNKQSKIKDPHTADLSPWTQHCGYLLAVPSASRITAAGEAAAEAAAAGAASAELMLV